MSTENIINACTRDEHHVLPSIRCILDQIVPRQGTAYLLLVKYDVD